MGDTYKKLAQGVVGTSPTAQYTVPSGTTALIRHMTVVNSHAASACYIKLWHDGSANANEILPEVSLGVGEFGEFDGIIAMEPGDTLQAVAEIAAAITLTVHGVEVT